MLFHKASAETEGRITTAIGLGVVALLAAVASVAFAMPSGTDAEKSLTVVIESPYAGQGVEAGTEVLMHGVKVGEVRQVSSLSDGGVRMEAELDRGPTTGLTDAVGFDFRPANYFGVTGINLRQNAGGTPLVDGAVIRTEPSGNFTLQALLSRLGDVAYGTLTPQLIDVVARTTTYIDGLDPLLETMLVVANSFADVQTVSTERLLANATGLSVAFPGFVLGAVDAGDKYLHSSLDGVGEEYFRNIHLPSIDFVATDLFGAAGKLVTSHSSELAPLTDMIKILTDIVPGLVPSDAIADTAREYRMRLERLFAGPPDRRAVNVRVILDSLPGVAAPLQAAGAMPPAPPIQHGPAEGGGDPPEGGAPR